MIFSLYLVVTVTFSQVFLLARPVECGNTFQEQIIVNEGELTKNKEIFAVMRTGSR